MTDRNRRDTRRPVAQACAIYDQLRPLLRDSMRCITLETLSAELTALERIVRAPSTEPAERFSCLAQLVGLLSVMVEDLERHVGSEGGSSG